MILPGLILFFCFIFQVNTDEEDGETDFLIEAGAGSLFSDGSDDDDDRSSDDKDDDDLWPLDDDLLNLDEWWNFCLVQRSSINLQVNALVFPWYPRNVFPSCVFVVHMSNHTGSWNLHRQTGQIYLIRTNLSQPVEQRPFVWLTLLVPDEGPLFESFIYLFLLGRGHTSFEMDHSPLNWIFILAQRLKSFTPARGSILKLVKLPILVAKCCGVGKICASEVCWFCVFLCYARKSLTTFGEFRPFCGEAFVFVILRYSKFANSASVYFLYFAIFRHQSYQFY